MTILTNLKMLNTSYGIAWTAVLKTNITGNTVYIPVENDGRGGCSIIRAHTKKQMNAVRILTVWALQNLPNDDVALENIIDFTDVSERLQTGLDRLRGA